MKDPLDFIGGSLFGDQELRIKEIMERIIYTKTLPWRHESEYRLAIPVAENEQLWNTLRYHPEEITELYLGLEMKKEDLDKIQNAACAINPGIAVFRAKCVGDGKLNFDPV